MENILYDLAAYFIVLFALFLAIRKMVHKSNINNDVSCSTGCGGCSSKCDLSKNMTRESN